jgi:hypothetical protein
MLQLLTRNQSLVCLGMPRLPFSSLLFVVVRLVRTTLSKYIALPLGDFCRLPPDQPYIIPTQQSTTAPRMKVTPVRITCNLSGTKKRQHHFQNWQHYYSLISNRSHPGYCYTFAPSFESWRSRPRSRNLPTSVLRERPDWK